MMKQTTVLRDIEVPDVLFFVIQPSVVHLKFFNLAHSKVSLSINVVCKKR